MVGRVGAYSRLGRESDVVLGTTVMMLPGSKN
jgi:hypothetical protein